MSKFDEKLVTEVLKLLGDLKCFVEVNSDTRRLNWHSPESPYAEFSLVYALDGRMLAMLVKGLPVWTDRDDDLLEASLFDEALWFANGPKGGK